MQSFDVISNSLLFLTYAERRYPSPSFSCPVDNRQLRSSVFSLSAVLKSQVLPVSNVYDMFS